MKTKDNTSNEKFSAHDIQWLREYKFVEDVDYEIVRRVDENYQIYVKFTKLGEQAVALLMRFLSQQLTDLDARHKEWEQYKTKKEQLVVCPKHNRQYNKGSTCRDCDSQ